jgi:HEAT repeat protein
MEKEEKVLGFVGAVSERAGILTSKVVGIGGKIAGVASDSISAGKEMIGLADDKEKDKGKKKSNITKTANDKSEPSVVREKQKPTKGGKNQSRLESQIKKLKAENKSLISELDQMRCELNESRSRESAVRARAAALESELETANYQLEEIQNKAAKTKEQEQKQTTDSIAKLESELTEVQRKWKETRGEAKEIQTQLKSQLKEMRAEKESLLTDLEIAQKDSGEIEAREKILTEEITALETKLAATQKELRTTQGQAEKTRNVLSSRIEALQAEKESLISDVEKMQKQLDDERLRIHSMEAQIASLKAEISNLKLEPDTIPGKEAEIDIDACWNKTGAEAVMTKQISESTIENNEVMQDQQINVDAQEQASTHLITEDQISAPFNSGSKHTDIQEKLPIPTVEDVRPSAKAAEEDEELIITNVENVEKEHESAVDSKTDSETEAVEPESEVEVAEIFEITVEKIQAADFKNEDEKALFTKAFSDFSKIEAALRANAAGIMGGIHHELSLRLLIAHLAAEPSAMVRQKCIEAISKLKMKEGVSAIEGALDDKAASVRLAAVWGLYRLAGAESVPKLISMLYDGDVAVRRRAITCIGWVGGQITMVGEHHRPRVISALIRCLNDPVESVRNAALNTLQSVTGKKMPASQTSPERLIGQWKKWWKTELSG